MSKLRGRIIDELPSALRELYSSAGYSCYRTVGFEEYDLFSQYRDFLTSGQMITFTGAGGRLLALKPDITMSIIRDAAAEAGRSDKFFYSESVYRVPAGGDEFKEILQIGLECIGDLSGYDRAEVVSLACKTLAMTGREYKLDISHTGLVSGLFELLGIPAELRADFADALKDKNAPMIALLCEKNGISQENAKKLVDYSRFSLPLKDAVCELRGFGFDKNEKSAEALMMLELIANTLTDSEAECVSLDFSVIHGMNYYDGTVFAGYIDGVAEAVLKGGEYGKLMKKMGREGSGLGFALYTDLLERLDNGEKNYAADVMLVCGEASPEAIAAQVKKIREMGKTVLVQKGSTGTERCAEVIILGSEV